MINEYELVMENNKLNLKIVKSFDVDLQYGFTEDLGFLLDVCDIPNLGREKSFVLSYDSQGKLNGYMITGVGQNDHVDCALSTAFKFLLLNNSCQCVFVHNHVQGGEIKASGNDYQSYYLKKNLCDTLGIKLIADVILQNEDCYYDIGEDKLEVL